MTENRKTPKLRFKGFTDAWEQRKFSDVVEIGSGMDYKHLGIGDIPVYGTGGYMLSVDMALSENNDAIGIGRKGTIDKPYILRAPFWTVDTLFYCIPKYNHYLDFTNCLFQNIDWKNKDESTGVPSLSKVIINNIETSIPSYEEQKKIGEYFKSFENLITLHQRKLDRLKNIKKSMLDKMFPKDGEVVPEIRFKGFTDAWEQRKLSEVLSSYTDPVEIPRTGYERLGIRSHAKGTFHNFVPAGHELQTAQMHRVAADKFIVNITFGWEHAVAVTDENDAGKLVSHRFPQFSLSEELDPKFLKFIILDEDFRHHLWLASPGGAGRNRVLNINEMLQYEIMIPNVPEQRKIARMLIDLDNLITLHQRKLDKLKNIKKSMLDNMFV